MGVTNLKAYEFKFDPHFSSQYDRAALTAMVETESQSKEDKFINDFFTNDEL